MHTLDRFLQRTAQALTRRYVFVQDESGEWRLEEVSGAVRMAQVDWFSDWPGGQIVVSTDVNVNVEERGRWERFKGWIESWYNRLRYKTKVPEMIQEFSEELEEAGGNQVMFSMGPGLFRGRYKSQKTGKIFDERSFSIDIRGVSFDDVIIPLARQLGQEFNQESVLVVNHATGQSGLLTI